MASLASCGWIGSKNVIITGATGVGKTFISLRAGPKGDEGRDKAPYINVRPAYCGNLQWQKVTEAIPKLLNSLARTDLLVLDDWGLTHLPEARTRTCLK